MSENNVFARIIRGELPANKVYEDDEFLAFHDIDPVAPVHLLLIPKRPIVSLQDVGPEDAEWLGRMMALIPKIAHENGCTPGPEGGFRVVTNSGSHGGQEVPHLHFHILGGQRPWKPKSAMAV